jgi:hypothetical protein
LAPRDQEFALSLIEQFKRRGALSDKQWPWVKRLAERASPPADKPAPRRLGDPSALFAMFDKARAKLTFPHLMLRLPDQERIKVWIAGPRDALPGALVVATEDRERLGQVDPDGTWHPRESREPAAYEPVAQRLCELIEAPQATLPELWRPHMSPYKSEEV